MSNNSSPASGGDSLYKLMGFVSQKPLLPEGWVVRQSNSYPDRIYYFNLLTGSSTWIMPELVSSDTSSQTSRSTISDMSDPTQSVLTSQHFPARETSSKSQHQKASQNPTTNTKCQNQSSVMVSKDVSVQSRTHAINKKKLVEDPINNYVRTPALMRECEVVKYKNAKQGLYEETVVSTRSHWEMPVNGQFLSCSSSTSSDLGGNTTKSSPPLSPQSTQWRQSHTGSIFPRLKQKCSPNTLPSAKRNPSNFVKLPGSSQMPLKSNSPVREEGPIASSTRMTPPLRLSTRSSTKQTTRNNQIQTSPPLKTVTTSVIKDSRIKTQSGRVIKIATRRLKQPVSTETPSLRNPSSATTLKLTTQRGGTNSKEGLVAVRRGRSASNLLTDSSSERSISSHMNKRKTIIDEAESLQDSSYSQGGASVNSKEPFETVEPSNKRIAVGLSSKEPSRRSRQRLKKQLLGTSSSVGSTQKKSLSSEHEKASTPISSVEAVTREDDGQSQMEIDVPTKTSSSSTNCIQKGFSLFTVLDTNILMHQLQVVKPLLKENLEGNGRLIVIIPWIVMQELDGLKTVKGGGSAQKAVQFLHSCLMNHHPRLRGEPPWKVSEEPDFEIKCNDDWILHCCLKNQKKIGKDFVVLVSDDKHLCSKAVISGINIFGSKNLRNNLCNLSKTLAHCPPEQMAETPNELHERALPASERSSLSTEASRELCDQLMSDTKDALHCSLSVVLKAEMKSAYNDLWSDIVFIKPPWSLDDLLQCFVKHWMAVFGMFLNREDKRLLISLTEISAVPVMELAQVDQLASSSLFFCRRLKQHSSYDGGLQHPMAKLTKVKKRCRYHQPTTSLPLASTSATATSATLAPVTDSFASTTPLSAMPSTPTPATPTPATPTPATPTPATPTPATPTSATPTSATPTSATPTSATPTSATTTAILTPSLISEADIVLQVFEAIWLKTLQLSALVFDGLHITHDLETDTSAVVPTKPDCHACLSILCPLLRQLIERLQRVTLIPTGFLMQDDTPFQSLCELVIDFVAKFITTEQHRVICTTLTTNSLQRFVAVDSNRQLLQNGIGKLTSIFEKLAQCLTALST